MSWREASKPRPVFEPVMMAVLDWTWGYFGGGILVRNWLRINVGSQKFGRGGRDFDGACSGLLEDILVMFRN